jgi:putative transposase
MNMARPLRIEFAGAVYHVTGRGNARRTLFGDDYDRTSFLRVLSRLAARWTWRCHAFCLMGNHYHLLIETERPTLSHGMRCLNGVFAQAHNRRRGRIGHVFQGRFGAVLVQKDTHLLELARYVVLNPCRARLCSDPAEWPWSSYRATAGLEPTPPFLVTDWLLGHFGAERNSARARYRTFVADRLASNPWIELRGQIYLGDAAFAARHSVQLPSPEVPRVQKDPVRPSLARLEERHREQAVVLAYREHHYSLREIGDHFGIHYSTVSRWLRRLEQDCGHARPDPK